MQFTVLAARVLPPTTAGGQAFLLSNNWDDYHYKTLFTLTYVDNVGVRHPLGGVKIARFGMAPGEALEFIPTTFRVLPRGCFSLGQDDSYYETLNALGPKTRDTILRALRDLAADPVLFDRALNEKVTGVSLLRSVPPETVRGQFRRLVKGEARLSPYSFTYELPPNKQRELPVALSFDVRPESQPPTNVHVLIGRNGVGKTRLLHLMSRALVDDAPSKEEVGRFEALDQSSNNRFANLVSVTFSAFDSFEPLPERHDKSSGIHYSYVGLKRRTASPDGQPKAPKTPEQLGSEFVGSVRICRQGARADRWRRALQALEADPIFRETNVASLADQEYSLTDGSARLDRAASAMFQRLSSGHKIVLLIITRLVETVEERSLVLIDEPEAHLHPPLLSAFVRSLSGLLGNRNGVAILATHSPVILQEVPKSCVWKIRRTGSITNVDRPEIETFGENVGILTREAFALEVAQTGFHRLLIAAVESQRDYNDVVAQFGGQLGGEAQALVRAFVASGSSSQDDD